MKAKLSPSSLTRLPKKYESLVLPQPLRIIAIKTKRKNNRDWFPCFIPPLGTLGNVSENLFQRDRIKIEKKRGKKWYMTDPNNQTGTNNNKMANDNWKFFKKFDISNELREKFGVFKRNNFESYEAQYQD